MNRKSSAQCHGCQRKAVTHWMSAAEVVYPACDLAVAQLNTGVPPIELNCGMITISEIEKAFGLPAPEWAGKCYEVACAAADLIDGAVAVYGHYLGDVAPGTLFSGRPGFVQHGWVLLPDGSVLDPTRWAFEGVDPYLYVAPMSDEYDEGGNKLRTALQGQAPTFNCEDRVVNIKPRILPMAAWAWMESVLGLQDHFGDEGYEPGDVGFMQLVWIANLDPRMMGVDGEHTVDIYAMLGKLDQMALVPIDNQLMVEQGRHRKGKQ